MDGKYYLANPTIDDDSTPVINIFDDEFYVMDEFETLNTIWELKSYLPMMDSILYSQLKDNIKKNGLNDPILYFNTSEGKKLVLEGHTRLDACIELNKKEIPTKEIKEDFKSLDDIKFWMVKHQFQRRNLSSIEKIQLAYLSKSAIEKNAKNNLSKGGKQIQIESTIDTNAEIAKIAGVGRTTVVRYNSILDKAPQSIIDKLNNGQITISTAHNSIKNEPKTTKLKLRREKNSLEINEFGSIEEGKHKVLSGDIKGLIVLKDRSKLDTITQSQKNSYGIYFIEK